MTNIDRHLALLKNLIATPSLSKEEDKTAHLLCQHLTHQKISFSRLKNNVLAKNKHFDPKKPTILLNSHHDTVKPNASYTRDPFLPAVENGVLYGLGSNDAGGCLVSLLYTFDYFYAYTDLPYNLLFVASAEEEISGQNGIRLLVPDLPAIDFAITGEPTKMQAAIAEKGLMVLDITVNGIAGHAARSEGQNAILRAVPIIQYFDQFQLDQVSDVLGPIKATVTQINAGSQHNVVPDQCQLVVDVRTTDVMNNADLLDRFVHDSPDYASITARSTRLNPSFIKKNHPFVKSCEACGHTTFGSQTLSDQALLPYQSVKIGPGDSARSHTADEYITINELKEGCHGYVQLLNHFFQNHE